MKSNAMKKGLLTLAGVVSVLAASAAMAQVATGAPDASPRVDAIRKAGALRVGVLANAPWLIENMSGQGEAWSGPAWMLAQEYARRLKVKLEPILVSHETKVPVLASNQVDISITPLAERRAPQGRRLHHLLEHERLHVRLVFEPEIQRCQVGRRSQQAGRHHRVLHRRRRGRLGEGALPEAHLRGVAGSGVAPVEEVMAKRADAAPINRVPWVAMGRKLKQLAVLPKDNNCQNSKEKAAPVGMAIDKNQPAFLQWLRAVETEMEPKLNADEARVVNTMK